MAEQRPTTSEVKESMLTGVRWVAGGRAVSEIASLASTVVLARLIAPSEFGRAVVALVIANVASVLASHAFASRLIQQDDIGEQDVRTAVTLNVSIGLILSTAVFALAGPISTLTGEGQTNLIRAISPACLLAGLNAVPAAMLQRRLDFRRLSMIAVASLVVQICVSVGLAIAGANATAIVAGALAAQVVGTIASLFAYRPPAPRFNLAVAQRLAAFGGPTALSSLVFTAFQNVDYAVIGARLNPTQLAFYYRAFQYGVDYQSKISRVLVDMAFPVFSRMANHDEIRAVRSRIVRVHVAVIFPLLAAYAALAPTLVPWLLGSRWAPVVTPSQYLVVAGAVTTILTGTGALLLAVGRPGLILAWNVGHLLCYGAMVYLVAPRGIVVVAAAVAAFYVLQGLAAHWFLLRRMVGIPMRDLFHELAGPCVGCAALVACAVAGRAVLTDLGAPAVVTLVVAGATGVAAYLASLRYLFGAVWADLILLGARLMGKESSGTGGDQPAGLSSAFAGASSTPRASE
jgi:O-antigen/teichoic acid export membrane protein